MVRAKNELRKPRRRPHPTEGPNGARPNGRGKKSSSRKAYRLTYKDRQQKTRTVYVRQAQLPKVRKMIANYAHTRSIIEQLVEVNIELFRAEAGR